MTKEKEARVMQLDPNRFKVAQSMTTHPGGPTLNYPVAQEDFLQPSSLNGVNTYPYGDLGVENPEQLGSVMPMMPSQLPQQNAIGTGWQEGSPYNMQQQPPHTAGDDLLGNHAGSDAQSRGLNPSYMGPIGMQATPAPGGVMPSPQQTETTLGLTGMPNAEMAATGGMNTKSGKRG